MPWKFKYLEEFLREYKKVDPWKRQLIYNRIRIIREMRNPIKGYTQDGKLLRYPILGAGNQLLAKLVPKKTISFFHIQKQ